MMVVVVVDGGGGMGNVHKVTGREFCLRPERRPWTNDRDI